MLSSFSLPSVPSSSSLLLNGDSFFLGCREKYKSGHFNAYHWLEGYSEEPGVRSMFSWSISPHLFLESAGNNIPSNLPNRWDDWLPSNQKTIAFDFARDSYLALSSYLLNSLATDASISFLIDQLVPHLYVHCRFLCYYPQASNRRTSSFIRAPEHRDPSLLTLLAGSSSPGLQLYSDQGIWQDYCFSADSSLGMISSWLFYLDPRLFSPQLHRVVFDDSYEDDYRFSLQSFLLVNVDCLEELSDLKLLSPHFASSVQNSFSKLFLEYLPSYRWRS